MSTLTFDTLKYTERLRAAKSDIDGIERKLIGHDGKFTLLQWMIGFNLAFTMAVLWKVFS